MALQLGTTPIGVTIQVADRDGNLGSTTFHFPNTLTVVDLVAAAVQAETAINLLTSGEVAGGSISIPLVRSTPMPIPGEASDVERKGVFVFNTTNPASLGKIEIPSIDNARVLDGTNIIDSIQSAAVVAALTGLNAMNGVGFDLVSLRSAYKSHRRSRRG